MNDSIDSILILRDNIKKLISHLSLKDDKISKLALEKKSLIEEIAKLKEIISQKQEEKINKINQDSKSIVFSPLLSPKPQTYTDYENQSKISNDKDLKIKAKKYIKIIDQCIQYLDE